ncbi:hypothetical protein GCM10012275_26620 [Longimycelium tulufanense]|uniref:MmcQ/YjbR family DNA-binding protein n=1 Tax=Longimycelium tulufanense TaxID=907463 RepID=A0A8J3CDX4_9PSEU|nr:MmcQ/YjbR family DNA-binding protein [Longimycelium tulufanense]GGM54200.1 hypothetical protein GCM10012275_26620 [Longimycelium tulufanense]
MRAADLRWHALSLPAVEEVETWGLSTFRVRRKIFAMLSADGLAASIKATPDVQAALTSARPDIYSVAAYVGRYGWVSVVVRTADHGEVCDLLTEAWRRTAPKRVVTEFDAGT